MIQIEDIIDEACADDIINGHGIDSENFTEIVTPELISTIVKEIWQVQERLLTERIIEWRKNENKKL